MLTFLAQSVFSAPDPLAQPGGVEVWLNQRSAITGVALALIGLILLAGPLRGVKRGWLIGAGVVLLGAGVWGFGRFYVSDYEAVQEASAAFYAAVENGDRAAAEGLLASEVGVAAAGAVLASDGRGFLLAGIDRARTGGLTRLALEDRQAEIYSATSAKTQTYLRAVFSGGGPTLVWAALDWRKEGEAWKVRGVDVLLINGRAPGQALMGALR